MNLGRGRSEYCIYVRSRYVVLLHLSRWRPGDVIWEKVCCAAIVTVCFVMGFLKFTTTTVTHTTTLLMCVVAVVCWCVVL